MTEELAEKYKDFTYDQLKDLVEIPYRSLWKHHTVWVEDISWVFGMSCCAGLDGEIPCLYEFQSPLTWICTDTLVGMFFIYLERYEGQLTLVGVREQSARKDDSYYKFFSEKYRTDIYNRILKMLEPDHTNSEVIDLGKKIFSD
jgi:hypothetical protein